MAFFWFRVWGCRVFSTSPWQRDIRFHCTIIDYLRKRYGINNYRINNTKFVNQCLEVALCMHAHFATTSFLCTIWIQTKPSIVWSLYKSIMGKHDGNLFLNPKPIWWWTPFVFGQIWSVCFHSNFGEKMRTFFFGESARIIYTMIVTLYKKLSWSHIQTTCMYGGSQAPPNPLGEWMNCMNLKLQEFLRAEWENYSLIVFKFICSNNQLFIRTVQDEVQ